MISISIPKNNTNERKYILDIVFNEFLGIDYHLDTKEKTDKWQIELTNGNKLIFNDCLFNHFLDDLSYLKFKNIPTQVDYDKKDKNQFIPEKDIPIIYGTSYLLIKNQHNQKTITCGIDIFASIFFMLTRWEEYVNKKRDKHNRFTASESLAFKNNFLDRAVVNEYIEMLKNMLLYLDANLSFKLKSYQLYLTHDVDALFMARSWMRVFRIAIADLIKRKKMTLAIKRLRQYFLVKRKKIKDPFDTFDWMMDKSESIGLKSRFYFMAGGQTKFDNQYKINEPKSLEVINKIKQRKHIIGFHPSYNSFNNSEQFKKEKKLLEKVLKAKVVEGRQHYLRFEVPKTWQIWEDNQMKIDSTCGYADKEGFRCGTGDEFSVFNILTRKKLNLKERALVFMDTTHHNYNKNIIIEQSFKKINNFSFKAKKYNTSLTYLFHNSSFSNFENLNFKRLYNQLLKSS